MTKELKRLQPKQNELNFRQGFNFGMGLFTALILFLFLIIPMLLCGVAVMLAAIGQT
jgi:hypothetical protein